MGPKAGYLYLTDLKLGPRGLSRPDFVTDSRQQRRLQLLETLRQSGIERLAAAKDVQDYDEALSENLRLSGNEFLPYSTWIKNQLPRARCMAANSASGACWPGD